MKSNLLTMTGVLTGLSIGIGALLGWVHKATAEPIARSAAEQRARAISQVLPGVAEALQPLAADTIDGIEVLTAQRPDGTSIGHIAQVIAPDGFGGPFTLMVGFAPDSTVTGYSILSHAETPGLGAKMDQWFQSPAATVIGTRQTLAVTKDGGDIDAITGATITSRAFLDAINRARNAIYKP